MKKGLSALCFVLVTMVVIVSNALAAPARSNRNATLISVSYRRAGIVLLFNTSGLSKQDLTNAVFVAHSSQYDMDCSFVADRANVRCVVTRRLSLFSGESFHGTLAGFYFQGTLPEARPFPALVTEAPLTPNAMFVTETPVVTDTPMGTETAVATDSPVATDTPVVTETSTGCPAGQTLWYTFEYFKTSYQAEVWSDDYLDSNTFYAIYGVYPEYTSTYIEGTDIYYVYGYTASTSGYGATPFDNWDTLVSAYESDGFIVQQTGETCDFHL